VITQNIDGLHQKAGSKTVLELHGNVNRNYCMKCKKSFSMRDIIAKSGVPKCDCGGMIKPDVVLYGEGLDEKVLRAAITQVSRADTLIIGGLRLRYIPRQG
jgi:NAD-dependent deacetylase